MRVNLRASADGSTYHVWATWKDGPKAPATIGATTEAATKADALAAFTHLVDVAVAHGWTRSTSGGVRTPMFTLDAFPTATPVEPKAVAAAKGKAARK